MVKKQLRSNKVKQRDTISNETHMEVYKRLAKIRQGQMHNAPSPRVKKSK